MSNNLPNHNSLRDNFMRREQQIQQAQQSQQMLQRGPFYERQHIADAKDPLSLLANHIQKIGKGEVENQERPLERGGGRPAFPYGEAIDNYGRVINRETGNILQNGENLSSLGYNHRQPYDRNGPISFKTNRDSNNNALAKPPKTKTSERKRRNSKSRKDKKSSRNNLPAIDSRDSPTMERNRGY